MEHRLSVLSFLFMALLLSYTSCSNDDENKDCGKDIYDPMENNPAKQVEWIVDLIKDRSGKSGYISLYKMDDKNYYISSLRRVEDTPYKTQDNTLKLSMDQPPSFFYDSEGTLCATSPYYKEEDKEFLEEFYKKASFVAIIWKYESCYNGPFLD